LLVANSYGGAYRNTITELDPTTGTATTFGSGLGAPVGITVGPDGRYYVANLTFATLFGGTDPHTVQVMPSNGGTSQARATGTHGATFLAFVDNNLYVTSFYDSQVYSFAGDTGQPAGSFAVPVGTREVLGLTVRPSVPTIVSLSGSVTSPSACG